MVNVLLPLETLVGMDLVHMASTTLDSLKVQASRHGMQTLMEKYDMGRKELCIPMESRRYSWDGLSPSYSGMITVSVSHCYSHC